MPISSEELTRRLAAAVPRLIELRRASLELDLAGEQIRERRREADSEGERDDGDDLDDNRDP